MTHAPCRKEHRETKPEQVADLLLDSKEVPLKKTEFVETDPFYGELMWPIDGEF